MTTFDLATYALCAFGAAYTAVKTYGHTLRSLDLIRVYDFRSRRWRFVKRYSQEHLIYEMATPRRWPPQIGLDGVED